MKFIAYFMYYIFVMKLRINIILNSNILAAKKKKNRFTVKQELAVQKSQMGLYYTLI
jgi:hypothetical protein